MFSQNSRALTPAPKRQLSFAPLAWLKLQWFCHAGATEIGGFGVSTADNLLHIEDFCTVRQRVSAVSVEFDDSAVADFFDACIDRGLHPQRFARLWIHTHPGWSPRPSNMDEETFASKFGHCDWSVMFILARTGHTYARLAFAAGPGGQLPLPVAVRWDELLPALAKTGSLDAKIEEWRQEYLANVHAPLAATTGTPSPSEIRPAVRDSWDTEPWREEWDAVYYEPTYQGDVDGF